MRDLELVLELADRGILFDPSLRSRVYIVGAFWSQLLRGDDADLRGAALTMFVSHAFLHGGFLHMAMNMAVLLGARPLRRPTATARGRSCRSFLVGALGGGAVFGLISASADPDGRGLRRGLRLRRRLDRLGLAPADRGAAPRCGRSCTRILTLAGLNVVFFFGLSGMLAWEAHLGGFVAGLGCGVWLDARRDARLRRDRADARARRDGERAT